MLYVHFCNVSAWTLSRLKKIMFMCNFSPSSALFPPPALLWHPHRSCLLLMSCHLAESRVWWRGDSTAGLREASELHSSVSPFYHPDPSVSSCQNYLFLHLFSIFRPAHVFSAGIYTVLHQQRKAFDWLKAILNLTVTEKQIYIYLTIKIQTLTYTLLGTPASTEFNSSWLRFNKLLRDWHHYDIITQLMQMCLLHLKAALQDWDLCLWRLPECSELTVMF